MTAVIRYNYIFICAHSFLKDQIREVISRELYFSLFAFIFSTSGSIIISFERSYDEEKK